MKTNSRFALIAATSFLFLAKLCDSIARCYTIVMAGLIAVARNLTLCGA